jgi:GDP-L-fucose synthase
MAEACLFLMEMPDEAFSKLAVGDPDFPLINIGCGEDLTIKELAHLIKGVVGFEGEFDWDRTKPDGTPRKLLSVDKLNALGWKPKIGLREGIAATYEQFLRAQAR